MPLPSQSSRPGPSRASRMVSSRRAKRPGRRVGAVVVGLTIVIVGWWLIFGRSGEDKLKNANASTGAPETKLASSDALRKGGQTEPPTLRNGDPAPFHRADSDNTWSDEPATPRDRPADTLASNDKPVSNIPTSRPIDAPTTNEKPVTPAPPKQDPPATQTPPVTQTPATTPQVKSATVRALVEEGAKAAQENRLVEARRLLNRALHDPGATAAERAQLRDAISQLNETLVFSAAVTPGDPLTETYTIKSGDVLSKVVRQHRLAVEWGFIQRINKISDPGRIRVGQNLKFVRGPFHAVVDKSDFRMDIYADINDGAGNRMYIRSFRVGLGEHGSTPTGAFVVNSSKMVDPEWINPRTREKFASKDPKNPIGNRWMGLTGTDPENETLAGYGIHGTIEPDSIGKEMSMGCIRCLPGEIEVVYEMLTPEASTVEIVP